MIKNIRQAIPAVLLGGSVVLVACGAYAQEAPNPTVAVSLEKEAITQHEPVVVAFTFGNSSSKEIDLDLGYDHDKIHVTVADPDGRVWRKPPPVRHDGMQFGEVVYVAPGTASVSSAVLNDWFSFDKVGTYQIDVALTPSRDSSSGSVPTVATSLVLTVLPRDEASLASACGGLVTRVENPKSAADASTAADALTRVDDPSAVPFLTEAMQRKAFAPMMIAALAHLNTPDAVSALVSASRSGDGETSARARAALAGLREAELSR